MSEDSNGNGDDASLVDTRTRLLIDNILFVLGMTMFVVGLVGEILGWWEAVGIILSLGGLVVGLFSAMDRNGVALIGGQSTTHTVLMRVVNNQTTMLGTQQKMFGNQQKMLGNQEEMVGNQEKMVSLLERIADTLDERLPGGD